MMNTITVVSLTIYLIRFFLSSCLDQTPSRYLNCSGCPVPVYGCSRSSSSSFSNFLKSCEEDFLINRTCFTASLENSIHTLPSPSIRLRKSSRDSCRVSNKLTTIIKLNCLFEVTDKNKNFCSTNDEKNYQTDSCVSDSADYLTEVQSPLGKYKLEITEQNRRMCQQVFQMFIDTFPRFSRPDD